MTYILFLLGFLTLVKGASLLVDGAVAIAQAFGMSETLVGLTIVAIGTSLPELATSAVAAWRGNSDLALGNVLGSNIFNIYFVLGVTATVRPLPFHAENTVDLIAMVGANLLLFAVIILGRRLVLARWLFLFCYCQACDAQSLCTGRVKRKVVPSLRTLVTVISPP